VLDALQHSALGAFPSSLRAAVQEPREFRRIAAARLGGTPIEPSRRTGAARSVCWPREPKP